MPMMQRMPALLVDLDHPCWTPIVSSTLFGPEERRAHRGCLPRLKHLERGGGGVRAGRRVQGGNPTHLDSLGPGFSLFTLIGLSFCVVLRPLLEPWYSCPKVR